MHLLGMGIEWPIVCACYFLSIICIYLGTLPYPYLVYHKSTYVEMNASVNHHASLEREDWTKSIVLPVDPQIFKARSDRAKKNLFDPHMSCLKQVDQN